MDHFHLLGIVIEAQHAGKLPDDVLAELRVRRETPNSRKQLEDNERFLSYVLRAVDEDALMQLVSDSVKDDERPN